MKESFAAIIKDIENTPEEYRREYVLELIRILTGLVVGVSDPTKSDYIVIGCTEDGAEAVTNVPPLKFAGTLGTILGKLNESEEFQKEAKKYLNAKEESEATV